MEPIVVVPHVVVSFFAMGLVVTSLGLGGSFASIRSSQSAENRLADVATSVKVTLAGVILMLGSLFGGLMFWVF